MFVGIGPAAEVTQYLGGVERDVVDDLDNSGDPEYSRRSGGAPTGQPGDETFWVASTAGVPASGRSNGSRRTGTGGRS